MLVAAMSAPSTRIRRVLLFALLAATLSSCSCDSDNPVTPPLVEGAPTLMAQLIGNPRVKVVFNGNVLESPHLADPTGTFSVTIQDSILRRTFLPDVRLEGVPMHRESDPLGNPARYTMNVSELGGVQVGDTLHFDVVDGGTLTTPFSYLILPSHMILPADSTVLHQSQDLVLPWTGTVDRVNVTISDDQSKTISVTYRVGNYSGLKKLTIPARDLAGLDEGELFVGVNVQDSELLGASGLPRQELDLETRQNRSWLLVP
jgi:hypothetical protein